MASHNKSIQYNGDQPYRVSLSGYPMILPPAVAAGNYTSDDMTIINANSHFAKMVVDNRVTVADTIIPG